MVGDLDRERAQLVRRPVAVREPRRVAEVQVVLGRQRDEQLVENGEASDAGVEHADGVLREHRHCLMVAERQAGGA